MSKICLLLVHTKQAQRHTMKKISYELDQVNDLLNTSLLVVNTTGRFYTIYKDNSRTHIIKSNLFRAEVVTTLQTIRELHWQGLIK